MSEASRARAARGEFTAAARRLAAVRAGVLQGVDLVAGELDGLIDGACGTELLAVVKEQTDLMWKDAQSRARFGKTGRYREAIKQKVFDDDDGPKGTVFVIQGPWDRNPSMRWPKNLPLWLEYGTRLMKGSRPHLIPAFNAARERFTRAVERLLQRYATS